MLSTIELRIFERQARAVGWTGVLGLDWNAHTKQFKPTKSWFKSFIPFFQVFTTISQIFLKGVAFLEVIHSPVRFGDAGMRTLYIFIAPGMVLATSWAMAAAYRRIDLGHLFNQMLLFSSKAGISSTRENQTRARGLELCVKGYYCMAIALGLTLITAEFILKWEDGWNGWLALAYVLHTEFLYLHSTFVLGLMQIMIYHFLIIANYGLTVERAKEAKEPQQDDSDVDFAGTSLHKFISAATHNYNSIFVICNFFNQAICKEYFPACKYLLSLTAMTIFTVGVRMKPDSTNLSALSLRWVCLASSPYLCGALIGAGILMSSAWRRGKEYLNDLEFVIMQRTTNITLRKQLKFSIESLPPIRVVIGGMYSMEKEAQLTLINFIFVGTMNMLLLTASR